jgi:hypothetical protein
MELNMVFIIKDSGWDIVSSDTQYPFFYFLYFKYIQDNYLSESLGGVSFSPQDQQQP